MVAVERGAVLGATKPELVLYTAQRGVLVDPVSASFVVYDISDNTKQLAPVVVLSHTVDLDADRVGLGAYAAAWTVSGSEPIGRHEIVWTWAFADGVTARATFVFEVLTKVGRFNRGLCLVCDLRAEGFSDLTLYPDAKMLTTIARATAYIERVTGRWFDARALTLTLDGWGSSVLNVDPPIVALGNAFVGTDRPPEGLLDVSGIRVYARHLSQGLTEPDDRDSPRVEFWSSWDDGLVPSTLGSLVLEPELQTWARGTQNITLEGVFGYTDPDGSMSSQGVTPELIVRACQLLTIRDLPALADASGRQDASQSYRETSLRTREQSLTLDRGKAVSGFATGDAEIDDILEMYSRPIRLGVVGGS